MKRFFWFFLIFTFTFPFLPIGLLFYTHIPTGITSFLLEKANFRVKQLKGKFSTGLTAQTIHRPNLQESTQKRFPDEFHLGKLEIVYQDLPLHYLTDDKWVVSKVEMADLLIKQDYLEKLRLYWGTDEQQKEPDFFKLKFGPSIEKIYVHKVLLNNARLVAPNFAKIFHLKRFELQNLVLGGSQSSSFDFLKMESNFFDLDAPRLDLVDGQLFFAHPFNLTLKAQELSWLVTDLYLRGLALKESPGLIIQTLAKEISLNYSFEGLSQVILRQINLPRIFSFAPPIVKFSLSAQGQLKGLSHQDQWKVTSGQFWIGHYQFQITPGPFLSYQRGKWPVVILESRLASINLAPPQRSLAHELNSTSTHPLPPPPNHHGKIPLDLQLKLVLDPNRSQGPLRIYFRSSEISETKEIASQLFFQKSFQRITPDELRQLESFL